MRKHNHITRDIKPLGECPGCDEYHDKHIPKRERNLLKAAKFGENYGMSPKKLREKLESKPKRRRKPMTEERKNELEELNTQAALQVLGNKFGTKIVYDEGWEDIDDAKARIKTLESFCWNLVHLLVQNKILNGKDIDNLNSQVW